MRYAPLTGRIAGRGSSAWAINIEARRRADLGQDVIMLTVGDPDQDPPAPVIEAAVTALRGGRTGYSGILGFPAVREAIAARVARRSGRPCSADNIAVVPGAQGGLYCTFQCIAGPGDEIIVGEPIYATYESVLGASGTTMVTVPLRPETGFHFDLDAVARAVTPRTRAIWINTPHNPTGAVMTRSEIEFVADLCRRHDLWLVSDEVYEDFAFARPHIGAWSLPELADRTVVISSLSKSHALPAFRFGWLVGPPALMGHMFNLLLCMTYGSPAFIQDGALAALREELPQVKALHEDYRRRAGMMFGLLAAAPGCRPTPPEGGMFVLLDIRGTGLASVEFAMRLLERENVAVLPCDGFGPSAAGHLRIALSAPDARLAEAAERILRFTEALPQPRSKWNDRSLSAGEPR